MIARLETVVAAVPPAFPLTRHVATRVVPRRLGSLRSLRFQLAREAPGISDNERLLALVRAGLALEELSVAPVRRAALAERKFALAVALARGCTVMVLEKMFEGLTPVERIQLAAVLGRLYGDGIAIYVVCASAVVAGLVAGRMGAPDATPPAEPSRATAPPAAIRTHGPAAAPPRRCHTLRVGAIHAPVRAYRREVR